ncbi:MAG: hypothetical protein ACYS7Y_34285 [Planctomycetota bacterium]|jgi:hypothetical protein
MALTVGELRAMLMSLPDDAPVLSAGPDCGGYAAELGQDVCAGYFTGRYGNGLLVMHGSEQFSDYLKRAASGE